MEQNYKTVEWMIELVNDMIENELNSMTVVDMCNGDAATLMKFLGMNMHEVEEWAGRKIYTTEELFAAVMESSYMENEFIEHFLPYFTEKNFDSYWDYAVDAVADMTEMVDEAPDLDGMYMEWLQTTQE